MALQDLRLFKTPEGTPNQSLTQVRDDPSTYANHNDLAVSLSNVCRSLGTDEMQPSVSFKKLDPGLLRRAPTVQPFHVIM